MEIVGKQSKLWEFLNDDIKGLILDGEQLLISCHVSADQISDFSYLVFPFAKAYEGFLKNYFLALGLIREEDFYGDDLRIGRVLNPFFRKKDYSVFTKLARYERVGENVAKRLWAIWKKGRNQIFHYFPHNFRRITQNEAMEIIREFASAMDDAVALLKPLKK